VYDSPKHWTNEFSRVACIRPDRQKHVLIEYAGNESKAGQFPHGNATKAASRNFTRTQPSVLSAVRHASAAGSTSSAQRLYQSMVVAGSASSSPATAVPRNTEQVRNIQKTQRNKSRLSRDAIYNIHELAYDLPFIQHISTFPDLAVILYHPELLDIFRGTLSYETPPERPTQQLSYDTTFNLGDFYLSVLLFRDTEFDSPPIFPLAYLIHERKLSKTHDDFFRHISNILPELQTATNAIIVTDGEASIRTALHTHMPHIRAFLCWNHLLQDCKRWLRDHGAHTKSEIGYYVDTVRGLLQSSNEQEYKDSLIELTTIWSQPFAEHFVKSIHPSIGHIGSWELRPYCLESVTTNQSETFNFVLKKLNNWKECPVDAMVLTLFRLAQYHIVEIHRGRCGLGNYVLRPGQQQLDISSLTSQSVVSPEDIVDNIRHGHLQPTAEGASTVTSDASATASTSSSPSQSTSTAQSVIAASEAQQSSQEALDWSQLTAIERASHVIQHDRISLNTKLAVFSVIGSSEPHVVRLFPSASCSCPAKVNCYHLLAARMSVGLTEENVRRPLNLTQLRRNKRKRCDKVSGRKRPRADDVDVVPAEDADEDVAAALLAAINADDDSPPPDSQATAAPSAADEETVEPDDQCHACNSSIPPPKKGGRRAKNSSRRNNTITWVECEECKRWYHCICVGYTGGQFTCEHC